MMLSAKLYRTNSKFPTAIPSYNALNVRVLTPLVASIFTVNLLTPSFLGLRVPINLPFQYTSPFESYKFPSTALYSR